jgi:hypothetical protein
MAGAHHNEKDLEAIELTPSGSSSSASLGHAHTKSADIPPLPSPAVASGPKPAKGQLSTATIIPIWIAISSGVIIYNNYLYNTLNFKFPVFLVTWHLGFAVSGPRVHIRARCWWLMEALHRRSARACSNARRASSTARRT